MNTRCSDSACECLFLLGNEPKAPHGPGRALPLSYCTSPTEGLVLLNPDCRSEMDGHRLCLPFPGCSPPGGEVPSGSAGCLFQGVSTSSSLLPHRRSWPHLEPQTLRQWGQNEKVRTYSAWSTNCLNESPEPSDLSCGYHCDLF